MVADFTSPADDGIGTTTGTSVRDSDMGLVTVTDNEVSNAVINAGIRV